MKEDEKQFLIEIYKRCAGAFHNKDVIPYLKPRDIINDSNFYINHKRAWYILEKWCGKGWYDYGVALDLGWFTRKGLEAAKQIVSK